MLLLLRVLLLQAVMELLRLPDAVGDSEGESVAEKDSRVEAVPCPDTEPAEEALAVPLLLMQLLAAAVLDTETVWELVGQLLTEEEKVAEELPVLLALAVAQALQLMLMLMVGELLLLAEALEVAEAEAAALELPLAVPEGHREAD